MLQFALVIWLPLTIAVMAIMFVVALGAMPAAAPLPDLEHPSKAFTEDGPG